NRALSASLAAITAAVVGVILNLALWFALHYLFGQVAETHAGPLTLDVPCWATIDWKAALLSAAALIAILRFKLGMLTVIAGCAAAGMLLHAF
ncbi:MAG TPA: chromate transporter, partial [Allosphingosinicella sp.]